MAKWKPIDSAPRTGEHIMLAAETLVHDEDTNTDEIVYTQFVGYWLEWFGWIPYPADNKNRIACQVHTHWHKLNVHPKKGK